MGYALAEGYFRHSERKVIFLGDFIDRGPKQMNVLNIVMSMVNNGSALAVMGNHEFNAIGYHTENPAAPGTWLRPRNNKNTKQHLAFLNEYLNHEDKDEINKVLNFFRSLPLWLDLNGLRVIHACWEPDVINDISKQLESDNTLKDELFIETHIKGTPVYNAIEVLLKGVEYALPCGYSFEDKDKTKRHEVRIKWWINESSSLGDVAFPIGVLDEQAAADYLIHAKDLIGYPEDEKPVFIGHYWLHDKPRKLADNVACLDYSVARGGRLTAYRWSGEQIINDNNFIQAG